MKKGLTLFLALCCVLFSAQSKKLNKKIVETACGLCQFDRTDRKGCNLAVKIDGKTYFVEGTSIDDHGDAHGNDGFCNTIRKAQVSGEIKNGKFYATEYKVLPKKIKLPNMEAFLFSF